jgi:CheY-like chemotaxis protein
MHKTTRVSANNPKPNVFVFDLSLAHILSNIQKGRPHMNLATQLKTAKNPSAIPNANAHQCCDVAKQLEKAGEYEAAYEALAPLWPDRFGPPTIDDLDEQTQAEVLLRVGALAGWLGSTQGARNQEHAKNLLTQSIELFEQLDQTDRAAEAQSDLALCYWREGGFDEARVNLTEALGRITDEQNDLKASILIRAGVVERRDGRLTEALHFLNQSTPLVEKSTEHSLKGSLHISFGAVLTSLSGAENREDYLDRALIEYAAASFHFEEAGHVRYQARVENNLGFLYSTINRFPEAHEHIDKARYLFMSLGDQGHVAQVDDTRARALLAEGKVREAERYARSAVKTLDKGDECSLLVEALTTHGISLARLGKHGPARSQLSRAIEVAETCGDLEGAGRAKLSIIEELTAQTSANELAAIFESAADLLKRSQDPSATKRLITCARRVINTLAVTKDELKIDQPESWEGFSLKKEITRIEKEIIARALREAGGSVSAASHLLGFKHHQSLVASLNSRHPDLLNTRSAVRKRRQHLFSRSSRRSTRILPTPNPRTGVAQTSILHVEDNQQVASLVNEMCTEQDWRVELSTDGDNALRKLTGNDYYDLVLVDNDIPGLTGMELVRRARKIMHRRRTPIIMLSGTDCENEAWVAGVDAFLKKPEQINKLLSTITRVLQRSAKE